MTHSIFTSPSHDARASFKNDLSLSTRQWPNFLFSFVGFADASGAASFERKNNVNLDDMLFAEAVICDRFSVDRWLKRNKFYVRDDLPDRVLGFLNAYWKKKRNNSAPTFYWSMNGYLKSFKCSGSYHLSQSFFVNGEIDQAPADLPWSVSKYEAVPEWSPGVVMPNVFRPPHGRPCFMHVPMKIIKGNVGGLEGRHKLLFPRKTVLGAASFTFYWPRGITHHFTDVPSAPGFDDGRQEFSWSNLKFGDNNFQSGKDFPLSSLVRVTDLDGFDSTDYGELSFDVREQSLSAPDGEKKADSLLEHDFRYGSDPVRAKVIAQSEELQAAAAMAAMIQTPLQKDVQAAIAAATQPSYEVIQAAATIVDMIQIPLQKDIQAAIAAATQPSYEVVQAAAAIVDMIQTPLQKDIQAAIAAATQPSYEVVQAAAAVVDMIRTPLQKDIQAAITAATQPSYEVVQAAASVVDMIHTPLQKDIQAAISVATQPSQEAVQVSEAIKAMIQNPQQKNIDAVAQEVEGTNQEAAQVTALAAAMRSKLQGDQV